MNRLHTLRVKPLRTLVVGSLGLIALTSIAHIALRYEVERNAGCSIKAAACTPNYVLAGMLQYLSLAATILLLATLFLLLMKVTKLILERRSKPLVIGALIIPTVLIVAVCTILTIRYVSVTSTFVKPTGHLALIDNDPVATDASSKYAEELFHASSCQTRLYGEDDSYFYVSVGCERAANFDSVLLYGRMTYEAGGTKIASFQFQGDDNKAYSIQQLWPWPVYAKAFYKHWGMWSLM